MKGKSYTSTYNRIMEVFWLAAAVVTLAICIYLGNEAGYDKAAWYFFMPVIALALWYIRRRFRKAMEKHSQD